ncbi:VPLPA-CTERM protein sorting domain [Methylophilaceae bacterium]
MKFKHLLLLLALFASSAQAVTLISKDVLINENQTVKYVDFDVTNAGNFGIVADDGFIIDNRKLNPHALLFSNPLSAPNFIAGNNNFGLTDDSFIFEYLGIGSYVLAVSSSVLTVQEAIAGLNSDVTNRVFGTIDVTIKSLNGKAEFSAVPVPAAAWLFGSALLGFAGFRRKSV